MDHSKYVTHVYCRCNKWVKSGEARAVESKTSLSFVCQGCEATSKPLAGSKTIPKTAYGPLL
jgi:hypothetical protein